MQHVIRVRKRVAWTLVKTLDVLVKASSSGVQFAANDFCAGIVRSRFHGAGVRIY